jgi:hypothetical protein
VNIIKFSLFGLQLQEPMAIITNGMIAFFCLFAFFQLKDWNDTANYYWKRFFLFLGISTFLGMFGHGLFYYFDIYGKIPSWLFGCISNAMAGLGMFHFENYSKKNKLGVFLVVFKSLLLFLLALFTLKFVFVAIDAIFTYIVYTGFYAQKIVKRGAEELKWMTLGVIIMLPSAFVFLFKLNLHKWLNKDDLSHLFILTGIIFFYSTLQRWGRKNALNING